jgi:hypothetical protein
MSTEICGHDLHDIIDGVDLWNANFISQLRAVIIARSCTHFGDVFRASVHD